MKEEHKQDILSNPLIDSFIDIRQLCLIMILLLNLTPSPNSSVNVAVD